MSRTPKEDKLVEDFTVPLNKKQFKVSEDDCFGREHDNTNESCVKCACNEVCAILKLDRINETAKSIQDFPYLDESDMEAVTDDVIIEWLDSKKGSKVKVEDLVNKIFEVGRIVDEFTAIERIKLFKKNHNLVIKQGEVIWE